MKSRNSTAGKMSVIDALVMAFVLAVVGAAIAATHPPHNETNGISCDSCHWTHGTPAWWDETPADIDDQPRNRVCWQSGCHDGVARPHIKTHSSLATSTSYGEWTWLCVNCHDPHQQRQAYFNEFRLYGKITGVNAGTKTFTLSAALPDRTGDGDPSDDYAGWTIVPNRLYRTVNYKIAGNTATTVTVTGAIQTTRVGTGSDYGMLPGRYLKDSISTPGGAKYVKFYMTEGERSYAHNDGLAEGNDSSPDGVCQVCHGIRAEGAEIRHSRADGTRLDHNSGANCIRCHPHTNGFAHGGGSGGTGCIECHGHDAGYEYVSGKFSQGRGTFGSHSTHTENDSDDRRGPNVNCDTCHDTNNFPYFKSGTDTNGDGRYDLSETDVCNGCHSPQGNYDGVNDREIGAKNNWKNGVYEGNALRSGKEKWCAGCHDNGTSAISGVNAPNVIGDEAGAYTYGTGWGYYKTGHGLPSSEAYPASGGITAGVGATCDNCHDLSTAHTDGLARTFDDHNSSATGPAEYRAGYRLRLVDGQEPMQIPKTGRAETSNYRLCVSCHTDTAAFTDPNSTATNFRDTTNRHYYHLDMHDLNRWSADWDFAAYTSRITCVTCHNVHGSTRLAMIRDGKLTGREPGIQIWYYNPGISTNTNPPFPTDLPLSASTGLLWLPGSAGNVCSACHGGTTQEIFGPRDPFQPAAQAPVLDWTGEEGYASDGAAPDSAASGSSFTFRVKYTDTNNDAPDASTGVQLWIDNNNDGIYESTYAMAGINDADNTYINGKIFTKTLTLTNTGGSIIRYRFYAKDTTGRDAAGPATGVSSVALTAYTVNNPPVLSWVSGSCRFEGVSPLAQVSGSVFDFRVRYTDADNNAPANMQVWVDLNDNGSYEAGEKYDMVRDGGDGDYRNGEVFTKSLILNSAGDGKIQYRFVFSDGTDAASGDPAYDHKATVINGAAAIKTVCASGCDYTTIQAAVNAISGGQTVLVLSGTYPERVMFDGNDNNKIVRSACGPDDTIIDASGATTYGVEATGSTGSVVDGFAIANGTIGVYIHHTYIDTNITIENCKIHDHSGGGIYTGDHSSITVNNSDVYSNAAGSGAGIYLKSGTSSVNDTIIHDNHASMNGGGVGTGIWNSTTFTNTSIINNVADGAGGGFAQTQNSSAAAFYKSTIRGNTAFGNGGGIYLEGEGSGYGVSIQNTVVADNEAASGGGIWHDGNLSAVNCTIANNRATGVTGGGGAIYANSGGSVTIRNSILWNNAAPAVGSRHIAYLSSSTPTTISDSILNNDGGTEFNRYPYIVVQDGGSLPTVSGFVSGADPFFADAANGDYHIRQTSGAIDHADAAYAPADDIDGDPRPQGEAADIGADEYRSSTANSAPVLTWTGEANFIEDGVNPDSGENGASFTFRVRYADAGGGTPVVIQLWLDRNDDEIYEESEKYALSPAGGGVYAITIASLTASGDGYLNYRFYASDGINDAVGGPTGNSVVAVSAPSVSFTSAAQTTANEGGTATITVQLSSASSEVVTVPFTVSGGSTATGGGTDYSITASPVTIPAGSTTADITVSIVPDTLNENNETVIVDMGAPANAVRGAVTTHILTITDDDPAPSVTFTAASQATAVENGTAKITAQLSAASGRDVTIPFTVSSGSTATGGGTDYSITASPMTISAGSTSADITVSIASDILDEDDETVIVDMGTPTNATQGAITTHILTITDDDPVPTVTFTSASQMTALESGAYTITAQLSAASGRVVTVPFTVNAGSTATGGGTDYSITASPVTISAGSTSAAITITVATDILVEGNETVIVDMGTPTNASQGATITHTLTIRDDDGAQIAVCSTNPAPFNKIQTTIADAGTTNGSTLLVCAGTYPEKVNFLGKNITVKAESGAAVTFITGDNTNNPVVTFSTGETSTAVLDGFTVDNQAAANNATRGISISGSSAPAIRNCVVKGNQMSSGGTYGAGIYINGGTATIQTSTIGGDFADKNSCQYGCGIYATALTGTLSISDSTISQNAGSSMGGGIYLAGNGTRSTNITNTAFTGNTAQNGGAIYNDGSILSISGTSSFNTNSASSGTGGGAIHSNGAAASTTVDGATFTGNTSSNQGGAIYMAGSTAATPLSISNSTFTNNTATLYGAAISLSGVTNATTISSTTISGGTGGASSKGAGIYISAAPLILTNTNVTSNTASLEGGGIWATGAASVINITNGSVSSNSGTSGAGIYLTSSASLSATGVTVSNNTSTSTSGSGAGIYAANGVTISGGTFANNAAGSSSGQGGAIYSSSSITLNGANSFTGNHASNGGGAIFLSSGSVAVNNTGNVFTNNYTTSNSGGAIYVNGAVTFAGTAGATFNGNHADAAGGGAMISQTATIYNAYFTGNYAKDNGGAFYPLSGTSNIYNSTFENNSLTAATAGGGAIYMKNVVYYLNIYNSTFAGNDAGAGKGGAIYTNTNASANIYNSTLYNNTGTTANSLYAITSGYIKLYNSIVAHPSSAILCANAARGGGKNVVYNAGTATDCAANDADRLTGNPLLSPLADNEGLTKTMAPGSGGSAIDTGDNTSCLSADQRGVLRPVDGDGNGSAVCDIGAFEYVP